jgi:hypothetical protein
MSANLKSYTLTIANSTPEPMNRAAWHKFVMTCKANINAKGARLHHMAGSDNWELWQNVVFYFTMNEERHEAFIDFLKEAKVDYKNQFIAQLVKGELTVIPDQH